MSAPSFASLTDLNNYLATRSYITGFKYSTDDLAVLTARAGDIGSDAQSKYPHVYRWSRHILALTNYKVTLGGSPTASATPAATTKGSATPATTTATDDVDDMFGDDEEDEEETEEQKAATKARVERMETARRLKEAKDAKDGKVAKAKPVEKSLVVLEVKPWEADTDLEALWHKIIQYEQPGLVWGATFKLEPVAYGIKKLVMTVAIEDDKVLLDDITETIEGIEEFVQSVQVASMNKI